MTRPVQTHSQAFATPCRAKNDLKAEKDPFKRAVLDGRQMALKVRDANSAGGASRAEMCAQACTAHDRV